MPRTGACSVIISMYSCRLESSVTGGAERALCCRRLVEEKFQRKNGYEADCDVIYGDTDSVMVNFRVKDIARAMELGQEAAAFVSKTFIKPIKLEFEKVCMPSYRR